jgi:5-hydroxyisourate hydrolase
MTALSTHVLDAVSGRGASGVPVTLTNAAGVVLAEDRTDSDGRIGGLAGGDDLPAGMYRLRFDTGAYFAVQGITGFYPEIVIAFDIADPAGRYHFPVLLSPYAYSTYRGS